MPRRTSLIEHEHDAPSDDEERAPDEGTALVKGSLNTGVVVDVSDGHGHAHVAPKKLNGVLSATWILLNDVLACTTVTLPFYFLQAGLPSGVISMAIYGLLCDFTLSLVYTMATKHKMHSFAEMCQTVMGRPGSVAASLSSFIFNYGGFVSLLMLLADIIPSLLTTAFGNHAWFGRTEILCITVAIFGPVAYFKSITRFEWSSIVSVVSIIFITGVLVVKMAIDYAHGRVNDTAPGDWTFLNPQIAQAIGGISYFYACHDMAFHTYHSLRDHTFSRYMAVCHLTMFLSFAFGSLLGATGYALFFGQTNANITESFPQNELIAIMCRIALGLNCLASIPYYIYMPRAALLNIIQLWRPDYVVKVPGNRKKRTILHVILTTILVLLGLGIAIVVTNLGSMLSFVGAVSAISISLILPALCYLALEKDKCWTLTRVASVITIVLGLVGMVSCIISMFI